MKQIFVLSKKDLALSIEEVLRLYGARKYGLFDNILVINSGKDFSRRLAYTNEVYDLLFECKYKDLEDKIRKFNWNKAYAESFSVRFIGKSSDEKRLAGMIYGKLENPKVDLRNPATRIVFFQAKKRVICGKLMHAADKSFLKRKAHLRPELHPTSLHPQLAKACINMTGKSKGKLLDPFCGSGGILIEAGLMGFKVTGYDIDRIMINRSRINLEHYKIKGYELVVHDATKIEGKFDCIVTDLPYGRNSRVTGNIGKLYKEFLESAYSSADLAVILFPDFVDYKKLLGKWKVRKEFSYYLHKSLSKKIAVLEK